MKKYIIKFYKKYFADRKILFAILLLFLSSLFLSLYKPILVKDIVDNAIINKNIDALYEYMYTFILMMALLFIIPFLLQYITDIYAQKTVGKIRIDLFKHMLSIPLEEYFSFQPSYLSNRILNDTASVSQIMVFNIFSFLTDVFKFIISLGICLKIDAQIGICYIMLVILSYINYKVFIPKTKKAAKAVQESSAVVGSDINKGFYLVSSIRANSWEQDQETKLQKSTDSFIKVYKKSAVLKTFYSDINGVISMLGTIAVIFIGGAKTIMGELSLGEFIALNNYLAYIIGPLNSIFSFIGSFNVSLVSLERIKQLFDIKQDINGDIKIDKINSISLYDVKFKYRNKDNYILDNLNLQFEKGNIYCIVGENGSGKTTLKNLMIANYYVEHGQIKYNDVDIKNIDRKSLHERVSVIEQEPLLFYGSIRENITINTKHDENSDQKLKDILKFLDMNYDINMNINEKNSNISGGEKQKISLARALYMESDVLILDEPTSALDFQTSSNLKTLLKKISEDKIVIIISHDKELINITENVIYIDNIKKNNMMQRSES